MPRYTTSPDEIDQLQWSLLFEAGRAGEVAVTLGDGTVVQGFYAGEMRQNSYPDEPLQWAGAATLVDAQGRRRTLDYLDIVGIAAA